MLGNSVLAVVCSLSIAAPSLADVRYAAPGVNGPPATCPIGDPCDLQDAIEDAAVVDGDVINLLPGTYSLPAGDTLHATDTITIQGNPGSPRPAIEGGEAPIFLLFMDEGGTLRDFRIVADDMSGGYAIGQTAGGTIERVEAVATGTSGGAYHVTNIVIRDSVGTVTSSTGAALELNPSSGSIDMRNLTLIGSGAGSLGARIQADSAISPSTQTTTIRNSIVRGGGGGIAVSDIDGNQGDDDVTVTVTFSNYSQATAQGPDAALTLGAGNQTQAPVFVAAGDYREAPGSPTIDAGSPDALVGSLDFLGGSRSLGESIDIGADEFTPRCAGRRATVAGTPGADILIGTAGADVVAAGGGADQIRSRGGKDLICAGSGNDSATAGAGADVLRGESGKDVLRGGGGGDRLLGGRGRDRLLGGTGADVLRGGPGLDLLRGGPGSDSQTQ